MTAAPTDQNIALEATRLGYGRLFAYTGKVVARHWIDEVREPGLPV